MRVGFVISLITVSLTCEGQIQKSIVGAWRRVEELKYEERESEEVKRAEDYLRYEFKDRRKLKISIHHTQNASNSPTIAYKIEEKILSFGFGRKFLIEEVNEEKLVLVDLEGGLMPNSSKQIFRKEKVYLDNLPLNPEDKIQFGGKTSYLTSEKLTPTFETVNPDFHQFVSMRMNTSYENGENYTHATLTLHPSGEIGEVQILHHVNEATDEKFLAAIEKSKRMWTLPKLNGQEVSITVAIEDRDFVNRKFNNQKLLSTSPLSFTKYPDSYLESFNAFSRAYLRRQYRLALSNLSECLKILPDEPNIHHAMHLCYLALGDEEKSQVHLGLVENSKLAYLLNKSK